MNGNTNIFLNGTDPTLGPGLNLDATFREIERAEQSLAAQKQKYIQLRSQMSEQQPLQQPQSQTPVWDEIDSITAQMTQKEFDKLVANDEFKESSERLAQLIQATQLAQIRPVIEGSQQGRDILDRHLTIIKRLKKSVSAEVDEELDDFQLYKEKYSDIPYSEYLKMKKSEKGGKR